MTWEETILYIRTQPEFSELVEKAYLDENLVLNVERFRASDEYAETKKIIQRFPPLTKGDRGGCLPSSSEKILDIGSGNGISAVSFARDGYQVIAVEPDRSETVGSGAIKKLKQHFNLSNLFVVDSFGENLPFENDSFDIVYLRQAMHHANNLRKFVSEATRVLKPGGLFLSVRDHVIYNTKDKELFLESHPLHKFYDGENAYTLNEYKNAMQDAGLRIKNILKHFDNVINYFPLEEKDIQQLFLNREKLITDSLNRKLPSFLAKNSLIKKYYSRYVELKLGPALNEATIAGRMYSFIALKPL